MLDKDGVPRCDMRKDCPNPVTHIGEKGYIYCATCASRRNGWERCRKMRAWELKLIRERKPLPSYQPISLQKAQEILKRRAAIRCAGCGLCAMDIEERSSGDLCGCAFMLDAPREAI